MKGVTEEEQVSDWLRREEENGADGSEEEEEEVGGCELFFVISD